MRKRCVGEAGVTVVEAIITTALLMIVLLTVFNSLDTVSKSQAYQADRTQNLDEMRNVLNRMTREMRQATTIVNPTPATPSTVSFNTAVNGTSTTIVYNASGTTLTRKVGSGAAFTVLTNLASTSIFTLVSATTVTGVQWIEIDLQVTPKKSPTTTLRLESEVNLRNRTSALTGSA